MSDKKYIVSGFLGLDINETVSAHTPEEAIEKLINQIGKDVNYEVLRAHEISDKKSADRFMTKTELDGEYSDDLENA